MIAVATGEAIIWVRNAGTVKVWALKGMNNRVGPNSELG